MHCAVQLTVCLLACSTVHGALTSGKTLDRKVVSEDDEIPQEFRQAEGAERTAERKAQPIVELDVNLMTGATSSFPAGMTWHTKPTAGSGDCSCDRQGVLKLTMDPGMGAEIKMTFSESWRYSFNVGDSVSNNAWAGDANDQKNDAEVHSYGNSIFFYGRDNPSGGSYGLLHSAGSFVAPNPFTTLTLRVADQLVTADNGLHTIYLNSFKMFALNGQPDSSRGGVNQDVYLGMNRVVQASSNRVGRGLCRVSVRFYPL